MDEFEGEVIRLGEEVEAVHDTAYNLMQRARMGEADTVYADMSTASYLLSGANEVIGNVVESFGGEYPAMVKHTIENTMLTGLLDAVGFFVTEEDHVDYTNTAFRVVITYSPDTDRFIATISGPEFEEAE